MSIIPNLYDTITIHSKVVIHSRRSYGEPKLPKPKELKNIKQTASIQWVKKCRASLFVCGNDAYIRHRDFNSVDTSGINHNYRMKFIYKDTWWRVVFRGEAWIKIENIVMDIQSGLSYLKPVAEMLRQIDTNTHEWKNLFEQTYKETANYLKSTGA